MMYPTKRNFDGSEFYSLAGQDHGRRLVGEHDVDPAADQSRHGCLGGMRQSRVDLGQSIARTEAHRSRPGFSQSPIHGNAGPIYVKRKHVFDMPLSGTGTGVSRRRDQTWRAALRRSERGQSPRHRADGAQYQRRQTTVLRRRLSRPGAEPSQISRSSATAQVSKLMVRGKKVESVRYQKDGNEHIATADNVVLKRRRLPLAANSHALGHRPAAMGSSVMVFRSSMSCTASAKIIKIIRSSR